ncbi:UNVERIFIED_CONTAM: hypothetical protein K2H54_040693 [Gekko kuhli]
MDGRASARSSSIRLADGNGSCEGRVEVYRNGSWGTVCDDSWDLPEAQVVCRQLNCGEALSSPGDAHYREGSGDILLDEVQCWGNETTLEECSHAGWGVHDCRHKEDASVICSGIPFTTENPVSSALARSSSIRLADGNGSCEGRVEVYRNGSWGTVCDDSWDLPEAQVVCRQLNCGEALSSPGDAHYREGSGDILLDEVQCWGNETTLEECSHAGWGVHDCRHKEDASVICSASARSSSIRLADGNGSCEGRVEVYRNGSWGTVCDDSWDLPEAQVVCRQLNCGEALSSPGDAHYREGSGDILLDEVQCWGNETTLEECSHAGWGVHDCRHKEDASVICSASARSSSIRLADGNGSCEGRVEVYRNGSWGTVCDDSWDLPEAQVVCRQLNCGEALSSPGDAHYREGSGDILLDEVQCWGNETTLEECSHAGWGVHDCRHKEDASVICSASARPSSIRLADGNGSCEGRVEVYRNGSWGTVCDDSWDLPEAQVVCRQLNCGEALSSPGDAHYREGSGDILLDEVQCWGNETTLEECSHAGWGVHDCRHKEDASVICSVHAQSLWWRKQI